MDKLPNEIENIIKDYVIFKPKTKRELREAIDLWDVSSVPNISNIFHDSLSNNVLWDDF